MREAEDPATMLLRPHAYRLFDGDLVLRPLTEDDWNVLLPWNQDPEVLYHAEGDDVRSWTLEEVQAIFRTVSRRAFCFLALWRGRPVGEGWLQVLNLERVRQLFPAGLDLRRIDLVIGEKACWGRGLGTRMLRLLTRFGFETHGADALFGCDVADDNAASRRMLERCGYRLLHTIPSPPGAKSRAVHDYLLTREEFAAYGRAAQGSTVPTTCRDDSPSDASSTPRTISSSR